MRRYWTAFLLAAALASASARRRKNEYAVLSQGLLQVQQLKSGSKFDPDDAIRAAQTIVPAYNRIQAGSNDVYERNLTNVVVTDIDVVVYDWRRRRRNLARKNETHFNSDDGWNENDATVISLRNCNFSLTPTQRRRLGGRTKGISLKVYSTIYGTCRGCKKGLQLVDSTYNRRLLDDLSQKSMPKTKKRKPVVKQKIQLRKREMHPSSKEKMKWQERPKSVAQSNHIQKPRVEANATVSRRVSSTGERKLERPNNAHRALKPKKSGSQAKQQHKSQKGSKKSSLVKHKAFKPASKRSSSSSDDPAPSIPNVFALIAEQNERIRRAANPTVDRVTQLEARAATAAALAEEAAANAQVREEFVADLVERVRAKEERFRAQAARHGELRRERSEAKEELERLRAEGAPKEETKPIEVAIRKYRKMLKRVSKLRGKFQKLWKKVQGDLAQAKKDLAEAQRIADRSAAQAEKAERKVLKAQRRAYEPAKQQARIKNRNMIKEMKLFEDDET